VDVNVRYRLVGGDAVVLPDGDTVGVEGADDRFGGAYDLGHERRLFLGAQVQDRLAVLDGDHEDVSLTALFVGDEHGRDVVSIEDGL
jgi:hypothetical protein